LKERSIARAFLVESPDAAQAAAEILRFAVTGRPDFSEATINVLEETAFKLSLRCGASEDEMKALNSITVMLARYRTASVRGRMAKIQEELANKTVQGTAGGGMVQVTVNGQFNLTALKIEPAAINPEEKDMLEDLILAAVNDGMRKARELASAEMAKLTGGLKIPGLMP
jgi:DNA-binding YbaB/EbfC family protein